MFRLIGTGDKAGSGADVIKTGWNENGWPDPELKEHFGPYTDRVELTLRLGGVSGHNAESKETGKETGKESNAEKVKDLMRSNTRITIKEMAERLMISDSGVEKIIRNLRKEGDIHRKGGRFGGEWEVLK